VATTLTPRAPAKGTAFYRRFGDARAILFGPHLLLLQVMHPVVGAGVVEHSVFREQAWKRLYDTLVSTATWAYGGEDGVRLEAERLRMMHTRITGTMPDGSRYTALAPGAWAWVYATLIRGSVEAQQFFGPALRREELEEYYHQARELGLLLGIREQDLPPTWAQFLDYFDGVVEQHLQRTEAAEQVLDFLCHVAPPRPLRRVLPPFVWRPLIWPVERLALLVTTGTLPPAVRARLGLAWSPGRQRLLTAYRLLVRLAFAMTPPPLRRAFGVVTGRWNARALRRRAEARRALGDRRVEQAADAEGHRRREHAEDQLA
jgi:uncharacterized protein (DUF2236 family)